MSVGYACYDLTFLPTLVQDCWLVPSDPCLSCLIQLAPRHPIGSDGMPDVQVSPSTYPATRYHIYGLQRSIVLLK